jgi:hypothetical protein
LGAARGGIVFRAVAGGAARAADGRLIVRLALSTAQLLIAED